MKWKIKYLQNGWPKEDNGKTEKMRRLNKVSLNKRDKLRAMNKKTIRTRKVGGKTKGNKRTGINAKAKIEMRRK